MALTEAEKARRKAQRRNAAALKRGENVLGGEFRRYAQEKLEHEFTPPPPLRPEAPQEIDEGYGGDYWRSEEEIAADLFAQGRGVGEGAEQIIPHTYFPTQTSYPSRLPQNKHPRTYSAGYARNTRTLQIKFWAGRNVYNYYGVEPWLAREFRMVESPGDLINDVLNGYEYEKIS